MDKKARRSSILKVRQPVDVLDETTAPSAATTTMNRRVSFHNVKHVKQYDREHGKIIEESPLREKITDTLDSDGILTPRGRTDVPQYNESFSVFGQGKSNNVTMDMSLETVKTEDETIGMFEGLQTICEAPEKENATIHGERDMSIDQSAMFAVPHQPNATINQSVLMDIDESDRTLKANDTMNMFAPRNNVSMEISMVGPNDTMAMFQSPGRQNVTKVFSDDDMEMSQLEKTHMEEKNQEKELDMDISEAPTNKNDTMQMFADKKTATFAEDKKVFGEEEMELTLVETETPEGVHESMDISMTPRKTIVRENDTIGMFHSLEQRQEHVDMDISQSFRADDTRQMFKSPGAKKGGDDMELTLQESPARATKNISMSKQKVFEEEGAGEEVPEENVSPGEVDRDQSSLHITLDKKEEERAEMQTCLMEMDGTNTTFNHSQKTDLPSNESISPGKTLCEDTLASPQKTMQIASDLTNTFHETSPIREIVEEVFVEHQSFHNDSCDMSVDMEVTSRLSVSYNRSGVLNRSSSSARKRRSLVRESPRRMAIENSMLSGAAEMSALGEYRRRKSLQTSQQHLLNSTNPTNTSLGRDIFAMNTSIRSPGRPGMLKKVDDSPAPEKFSFELPEFDAAVANIVWLTSENGHPIPEAETFANLLNVEKSKTESEIQKTLSHVDGAKFQAVRSGELSQLSHDEKEVVLFARGHAETRFLHLRQDFAQEHSQKYEEKISNIQLENAQIASQLLDLEDEEPLRHQLEEKRKHEVLMEADKIREEWRERERLETERRSERLAASAALILKMHQEKLAMQKEKEELDERMARLEDEERAVTEQISEEIKMVLAAAAAH